MLSPLVKSRLLSTIGPADTTTTARLATTSSEELESRVSHGSNNNPLRRPPMTSAATTTKKGHSRTSCVKLGGWFLLVIFIAVNVHHRQSSSRLSQQQHHPKQQQQQAEVTAGRINNHLLVNSDATNRTVVAYAISMIKCGKRRRSKPIGLVDGALVLRHSVHLQSSRNPASGSKYDYKMYVLVHPQAQRCSQIFEDVGFTLVNAPPHLNLSELHAPHLRENLYKDGCCGADEFIKLQALLLPEPIVVHVDIDVTFFKPMDDLYDALLYDASSPIGQAARARIPLERKFANVTPVWPHEIQAFITRDWPQVIPGRMSGFQAGMYIARTSPQVYQHMLQTIKESNYTPGYGIDCGWGGLGYGVFAGAMSVQGFVAYYYDIVRPNMAVELNQCRFNWMGMQVRYNAPPNFKRHHPKRGLCRNNGDYCEDCRYTPLDLIYNAHYTICLKPWNCISVGAAKGELYNAGEAIDLNAGDLDACLVMVRKWHDFRTDLEQKWYALTHDEMIRQGQSADYKRDLFQGHCFKDGPLNYNRIQASRDSFQQVSKLYD